MKKAIAIIALVALSVSFLASCKTTEKCPAYGSAASQKVEKSV